MNPLLAPSLEAHPGRAAVIDESGTTTWAQLADQVGRAISALRARGLAPRDSVVALLGNQTEAIVLSTACASAGWLYVPVSWHWVSDELAYVLDDTEASALVVDRRWVDVARAALDQARSPVACRLVVGSPDKGFEAWAEVLDGSDADPGELEKGGPMFYTSGTTGRPKGVRSALSSTGGPVEMFTLMAHSMRPVMGLPDAEPVQAICGPLYHSAQWVFASFALFCGATVVLQHKFDADELLTLVDRHGVTNLHLVPAQMRRLLDLPDARRTSFDGSTLTAVLHGAAPCPPDLKRALIAWWGPIVTEYYGGTEAGFITTITSEEWLERPGSVGRPIPIMEVQVRDLDGHLTEVDEPGDVWFRNVMGSDFEYHKAPDKTAASHRDGFGTLGDIGRIDADGYLYLTDRRIDMIVSGGVNIYPAEIETVLLDHPCVADAAVFGVPHHEMGEEVKAAVVLVAGSRWSPVLEADVVAHCRTHLAGLKCPRSFDVLAELPRLESGKLAKRVLRDPYWTNRAAAI